MSVSQSASHSSHPGRLESATTLDLASGADATHSAVVAIQTSPRPETANSPQPASSDGVPGSGYSPTRPIQDAPPLPRRPDEIQVLPTTAPNVPVTQPDAPVLPPKPTEYRHTSQRPGSELDWIVPKRELRPKSIEERLRPTMKAAEVEREKYKMKATMTGYALNIAIGMQVILGALTTGLAAATSGKQTSIVTAILGGLSTIVASYLARVRGSKEPELSLLRSKDLDQYLRECEIFVLDFGHITGNDQDTKLNSLRERFENIIDNTNSERRLALS